MNNQSKDSPQHIANIAHLFFADDVGEPEPIKGRAAQANIVVGFSGTGIAGDVCAYLNRESEKSIWRLWDATGFQLAKTLEGGGIQKRLVICLLASEVSDSEIALKMGRFLGVLRPSHLQVLVFAGDESSPPRCSTDSMQGDLLSWCGQLTRALEGQCSVAIAFLPADPSVASGTSNNFILKNIARRFSF